MIKRSICLKNTISEKVGEARGKIEIKLKGGLTTTEVLVIIAVLLLVTYPLYKDTMSGFMGSVKTWLLNAAKGIFV